MNNSTLLTVCQHEYDEDFIMVSCTLLYFDVQLYISNSKSIVFLVDTFLA